MANYDASIRIGLNLNTKSGEVQLERLENRMVKTSDTVASLNAKMDALRNQKIPTKEFTDLQREISSSEKELEKMVAQDTKLAVVDAKIKQLTQSSAEYAAKMKEIAAQKIPTEEYKAVQKELNEYSEALEKAREKYAKLSEIGNGRKNKELIEAQLEVENLTKKIEEAKKKESEGIKFGQANKIREAQAEIKKYTTALDVAKVHAEKLQAVEFEQVAAKINSVRYDMAQYEAKIFDAENAMERLKNEGKAFTLGIDTEQYKNLSEKYNSVNQELEKQKGIHSEIAQKQADAVQKVLELKGQMQQLVAEGKDFTLGQETEEFANMGKQLKYAKNELSTMNQQHKILELKLERAKGGYKKLGDIAKKSFEKINNSTKKSNGLLSTMGSRFKSLALSLLIFNQISKAFRVLTSSIKEGFTNLYEGNERFKSSVDNLKASALTLKNTLAAAFSPLVEIAIPYIQRFIDWLSRVISLIGQFIAALTGRKTYTKAIKQSAAASEEAADATEDETKSMNKQLSPLDKLNVLTSENAEGKEKDTGLDAESRTMFEEVPIDNKILDFLQKLKDFLQPVIDYAQKLKDIFMEGFWDGLGDWEYRWDSIKNSLASIKDSLIDIFTDPNVLGAADRWAQSVAYMLGSLAGSIASIGLTIATNLIGGIAKYLEQNKERIKEYLISVFDIWSEINMMFAELFQSIAYVFEAFASENGQRLTANIIGIFFNAFMGITELASKLFCDISNIIAQLFVDNKEGLRTALEGFFGVLSSVTGTVKDSIDATFDKLNEVYDAHFKPFFDSVSQGLSDLLGQFLEFWNGNVQPILNQWATDFDELWKSHIQPLLDNAIEFLGKIADLLKTLWENILQPFISWFISNILPRILPIIQAIWNTLKDFIGYVADLVNDFITILGGIIDFLTGVFYGDWEKAFNGILDIAKGCINFLKDSIEGGIALILDAVIVIIRNYTTGFSEAGQNIVQGLIDGILSFKDKVVQAITDITNSIIEWFKEALGIHSPSTVMAEMGKYIIQGLLNGLKNTWETVTSWLQSKIQWLVSQVQSILSLFGQVNTAARSMTSGALGSAMGGALRGRTTTYNMSPSVNAAMAGLSEIEFPGYATGQVIPRTMRQHLAILGDNNREMEVVSPLSTIEQAVRNAIGGGQPQEINLNLTVECEGHQLLQIMQKLDGEYFKQTGKHAFA